MKKKWTYLAVAGMLLGTAPVFTGCVDNDEPAGIEQLRGAKAQLLQAKAAVEEAKALVEQANAEYRQAEARWKRAIAAQAEYDAELKRLEVELEAAKNEKEKVRLQKEIADLQAAMEENALYHQTEMIRLQMTFEKVQRNYKLLMEQLQIADAIGSEEQTVTITQLKDEVSYQYARLYGGEYTEEGEIKAVSASNSLYQKLQNAQQRVYDLTLKQAQGIFTDEDWSETFIPRLEFRVAKAQANLDAEEEALTKLQEFLEKDTETADWRAEIAKLEDEIDKLKKDKTQKELDLTEAKNDPAYLDLYQALYGLYEKKSDRGTLLSDVVEGVVGEEYPTDWQKAKEDGAWQTYNRKLQEKYQLHRDKEFTLAEWAAETEISQNTHDLLNTWASEEGINITWTYAMGYDEVKYKYWYMLSGVEHFSKWDPENGEYPTTSEGAVDIQVLYNAVKDLNTVLQVATKKAIGDQTTKDEVEDLATEIAAHLTAMETEFQKNYNDTFSAADKAIDDAEKALVDADKKLADAGAKFIDQEIEIAKLEADIKAQKAVKRELVTAVESYLGIDWPGSMNNNYNPAKFEDKLQKAITKQQNLVVKAEKELADLKIELTQAQDGQYDALALAQLDLNIASYNFNQAWEAYQEALNNLELALAAIADEEEGGNAEQPGDGNEDPAGEEEQPAE